MKVSVAICTYNGERFLKTQINSILDQTVPVDEIVVCDDCSSDETKEILAEYKKQHPEIFKIHFNKVNLRSVKNFEKAISLCENEIIFLSDQDDIWNQNKVELFLEYFEKFPAIDVISSNAFIIDENDHIIDTNTIWDVVNFLEKRKIIYNYFKIFSLIGNFATGANMAFRKDFIESALPFPEKKFHHDEWIALVSSSDDKFDFIREKTSSYRVHDSQQVGGVFFNKDKNTESQLSERFNVYNEKDSFRLLKRRFSILKDKRQKIFSIIDYQKNEVFVKNLKLIDDYEFYLKEKLKKDSFLKYQIFKFLYF
ncbi:glycosyltransferase involved in cell wall biosynthesis [Chryseobacterium ginsenosidimutans]|uniref:glycosyltransferase family 2 protein n=1 Tax=Chryseobacterium ginsenosidimutans TaxID=687846 RepID=UPI002167D3DC|nr:glycosyltransferase family 2 protein [Chryseobacterium ginsenosidimutans]MCS3871630.1 glycosyltransferase involved in cell wall biosynthesis [Chryseobacterium ginsenosidimutans]